MASATWDEVRARRLDRSFLAARASADRIVGVAHDLCGAHAQVQASAELQLGLRIDGIVQADVRGALWEHRLLADLEGCVKEIGAALDERKARPRPWQRTGE